MTVSEAVRIYVAQRRSEGLKFGTSANVLRILSRTCGESELRSLTSDHLSLFLNADSLGLGGRISRFCTINRFVNYWSQRGEMPKLSIGKSPGRPAEPAPYIFSIQEVRSLLKGAEECQRDCAKMSGATLRAILLTLYATGATLDEVLGLCISQVPPKKRQITFAASFRRKQRTIPIGADLHAFLKDHLRGTPKLGDMDAKVFRGRDDGGLTFIFVRKRFSRLCKMLQLAPGPKGRSPRLTDLKYTFAVHRLTHWIRQKEDLNELIPALSTYMGYAVLTRAEQFLAFTPDRFKADLEKLSSTKGRKHWRNDANLLASLASLGSKCYVSRSQNGVVVKGHRISSGSTHVPAALVSL